MKIESEFGFKKAENKGKTTAWNYNLDASGRPLYDHNGKLSKHKRQGPIKAKTAWDIFR